MEKTIAGRRGRLFERPNKKNDETQRNQEKEPQYISAIGELQIENSVLKKSTSTIWTRPEILDSVEKGS